MTKARYMDDLLVLVRRRPTPALLPPSAEASYSTRLRLRLLSDGEDDSKARLAAHHAVVGFGHALQGIGLVYRPHAGPHAERERVLGIDRRPGIPALDRAAPHEQRDERYLHRLGRPDDQQGAAHGQAAL